MRWTYKQIVLDEPFDLSYSCVFKWDNAYYMIPDCRRETNAIKLYKSNDFPAEWSFVITLLDNLSYYDDPSIFRFDDRWWVFMHGPRPGFLCLYHAEQLTGPWIEHPESPVVLADISISRPGGRVVVYDGRTILHAQDGRPYYGSKVRAFEITELTTEKYKEKEVTESPILQASGSGWNAKGMHHIDPHQIAENKWIACVDGHKEILLFGLKY